MKPRAVLPTLFNVFILVALLPTQCVAAPIAKFDYAWLLKTKSTQVSIDKRWKSVIRHLVPAASRALITDQTWVSEKTVSDNRYITIVGGAAHHAMDEGLIWIDTASDKSIVVANVFVSQNIEKGEMVERMKFITRGYRSKSEFPKAFWDEYKPFIEQLKSTNSEVTFKEDIIEVQ